MKKIITLLLALVFCLSFVACGNENINNAREPVTEPVVDAKPSLKNFLYIGTWSNKEGTVYLRIQDGGTALADTLQTVTITNNVNGVIETTTSQKVLSESYSWTLDKKNVVFNGMVSYTPSIENDRYCLSTEFQKLYRVGDLDYSFSLIPNDTTTTSTSASENSSKMSLVESAKKYALGTTITAGGIEMVFNECGVKEDIRITEKSDNITWTSGPPVEEGKQYAYLKGTLKNIGRTSFDTAIAGVIFLDDYEFQLRDYLITTAAKSTSEVAPLETVNILLYSQITDEMAGLFSEGKIVFAFNDNFADVELGSSQYLYYTNVKK